MAANLLAWPVDELAAESKAKPFDCVVVGGGSAGLTVARTLAERDLRVAVLEAGPAPFLTHISNTELRFSRALSDNVRNQVQYGPTLPDGKLFGPNFGCLGGRGLFWNGAAPRFRRHDFEGWPFDAAALRSEYAWSEYEFRVTTALGETRLAGAIIGPLRKGGFDAVPGPFAVDLGPAGQARLAAGVASGLGLFLRGAAARLTAGNVRVATRIVARRVLLKDNAVRGVEASDAAGGESAEVLARSVVLAGGGVESVRLAALSGVPDRSGRIGLGVQDHLFYRTNFDAPALYASGAPDSAVVHVPSSEQSGEQWELHAPGRRLFSADDDGTPWHPAAGEAYWVMLRSFAATEKRDENRVESRPGGPGSATVHFTYSKADDQRKAAVQERGAALAKALGTTLIDPRFADPGGSYHEAGGLDMGTDAAASVTDVYGRFHAVPSLVAADAASFPRIGATNPHLTIVAVARRQAVHLADQLTR